MAALALTCRSLPAPALWAAALLAAASGAAGQAGSSFVDARCNIFGYGVLTPQPGGGGGGIVAVTISLAGGSNRIVTFSNTGSAWWGSTTGSNGPDGGTFSASTNISPLAPISGFAAPRSGHLVGLFLEEGDPAGLPAPANMSYPNAASLTAASFAPGLRQVFFIGDGLTGTGTGANQTFSVPATAARLVLGIADGFGFSGGAGYYTDNTGGYNVSYWARAVGTCYANCDGSTLAPILNVNDFTCFLNFYAAGNPYANCDASTIPPVLNVNDFLCFLNVYAVGCP